MSDEVALLRAVAARPDDDTPRLVYADWLDDNAGTIDCPKCGGSGYQPPTAADFLFVRERVGPDGHVTRYVEMGPVNFRPPPKCDRCRGTGAVADGRAARAEFIRVQVELARSFPDLDSPCMCKAVEDKFHCPRCMAWDESESLRERERRLWGSWPDRDDQRTYFHNLLGGGDPPTEWVILPGSMASNAMGQRAAVVRRGFVDEVRLSLAALVGGACPRCEGRTWWHRDGREDDPRDVGGPMDCEACGMTGRTPGLAPALGRVVGLRAVVPIGIEPRQGTRDNTVSAYAWSCRPGSTGASFLPPEIFRLLPGGRKDELLGTNLMVYPSHPEAMEAASTAALAFCKSEAARTAQAIPGRGNNFEDSGKKG